MKEEARKILIRAGFTGPSVEECLEDWCSKQTVNFGLVSYYKAYYNK